MKALKDKVNTVPPGGDYPYGDLRDNPGDNSGTPVNRDLMGDIHRTVEKIMDEAGIVANGLDDNEANGYQIYEAMRAIFRPYKSIVVTVELLTSNITVRYTDFPNVTLSLDNIAPQVYDIVASQSIFTAGKTVLVSNASVGASSFRRNNSRVSINTNDTNALLEIRIYN